jgi:hypothetical protein
MQNLDDLVEVYTRNYRFLSVPWQCTFSLVNFIVNNQKLNGKEWAGFMYHGIGTRDGLL